MKGSLSECADDCRDLSECRYFIFGTGENEGACLWEKTENGECQEGWEYDQYDFYEMISKFQLNMIDNDRQHIHGGK